MKKLILISILFLLPIFVIAGNNDNSGNQGNKSNITASTTTNTVMNQNQVANQGEDKNITEHGRETLQNLTEVKERIQERKQEMDREVESMPEKEQKVYRNQNIVREAVHNLLDMKDILNQSGIGQNVSQIAREFNNSVKVTIEAEEKIQKRSIIIRLLLGGDNEAAEEINQEVNSNRERVQKLNRLKEQIKNDEELKQLLQEQIQEMEQEQNRLQELAQKEKKSNGLFGWLFK